MRPLAAVAGAHPNIPKPRRLSFTWAVFWGCVCALGFAAIVGSAAAAERQVGAAKIVVHNVTGVFGSTQPPVVLQAGIDVFQNEIIKTDENSAARLVFQDQSELSIGASSEIILDRFVYDPDPSKSVVAFSVLNGVARFATGSLPKSSYSINTPTALVGVRGTILTITVTRKRSGEECPEERRKGTGGGTRRENREGTRENCPDVSTQVNTENGTAVVTAGGTTVLVNAGESTTVPAGSQPSSPFASSAATGASAVAEMNSLLEQAALQTPSAPGLSNDASVPLLNQPSPPQPSAQPAQNCVSPSGPGGRC